MHLRDPVFGSRRRAAYLAAVAATTLFACASPDSADFYEPGGPPDLPDAAEAGGMDAGSDDSAVDSAPIVVQPACASATTALVPALPATSGDLTLACGGTLGEVSLENCFCPASSPLCPDPIYGIPGAWNSYGGCGFCMNTWAVLCGTIAGTPYSCPGSDTCTTFTPDAASGYACCPAGDACPSLCSGVCAPGTTQCSDGGVQTCGDDDTWGAGPPCTGQACVNGACVGVCTPGPSECGDGGVETCNANGEWQFTPCVDSYCQAGKCVENCVTDLTQCVGNSLQTCGTDGTWGSPVACQGQACADGGCVGVCAPGALGCNGNAPETCDAAGEWDAGANCLAPATECNAGACVCPNGGTVCGGTCVNLQTDPSNCGACEIACSATGQSCSAGYCTCPFGERVCASACVDTLSDPNNCGTCATVCSATGQSCSEGTCACPSGAIVCNGACLDVQADPNNCGSCGAICSGTCAAGRCLSTLISGRSSPGEIVTDGNYLAWVEPDAGNVMEMLSDGGGVGAIASNQGLPSSIADYYGTVYWTNTSSGEIMDATLASGAPATFATTQLAPTTIAADPFSVSWIVNGNAIARELTNEGVLAWYSGSELSGLATTGSFTIWCDAGEVMWNEQPGGVNTYLATGQMPCAFSIPQDYGTNYVVWTNSLSANAVFAWYNSANDVGGGPPPSVIATGPATQTRAAITQDGVSAYWTNSDGTIMKVAITGGSSPVTLATGQGTPGGIALDNTSLYWTNSSAGTVMKLTPR